MSTEAWVALLTPISVALAAVLWAVAAFVRAKSVETTRNRESIIRDATVEGAHRAVEAQRVEGVEGEEKMAVAVKHAKMILDKYPSVPTPPQAELEERVAAAIPTVDPAKNDETEPA